MKQSVPPASADKRGGKPALRAALTAGMPRELAEHVVAAAQHAGHPLQCVCEPVPE